MTISNINKIIWDLDEEDGILNFRFANGIAYWLVVRYEIFKLLLEEKKSPAQQNRRSFLSRVQSKITGKIESRKFANELFRHDPLKIKTNYNCINVCTSVAAVQGPNGYRSRISGFLQDIPGITPLHAISTSDRVSQKEYEGSYCFINAIEHRAFKRNFRDRKKVAPDIINGITTFIELLKKKIGCDFNAYHQESIFNHLLLIDAAAPDLERDVTDFFRAVNPKLVLIEDGNYGGILSVTMIKVAKEMNIATGEIQHGVFDLAFKYADKLVKHPDFRLHKTDYVLTYGDYFTQYINSSSSNISIGNFFLETKKGILRNNTKKDAVKTILFITQMGYTDDIITILDEALNYVPEPFKLIIRLHPLDNTGVDKYRRLQRFPNTDFSTKEDLYSEVMSADHVIGSYSTVLFDAVFFYKVPLIYKNDLSDYFVPAALGPRFANAGELFQLIESPPKWDEGVKLNKYIWADNCSDNFKNFWSAHIVNRRN